MSRMVLMKLTVGSCFSGIGGIELGLERAGGFETKWQIENDDYATAVLAKHWPNAKRYGDIRSVNPAGLERVDLICGGYPCQPFSLAGARGGDKDGRHLWPEMLRLIRGVRPRLVLLENVPGHLSLGFGQVLADLAESGFNAEWQVLSAAGVGAPHLRRRLFIVAYPTSEQVGISGQPWQRGSVAPLVTDTKSSGWRQRNKNGGGTCEGTGTARERRGLSDGSWWSTESGVCGVAHGVPSRVDRLRCLGNAVVPQVAERIGQMILESLRWTK